MVVPIPHSQYKTTSLGLNTISASELSAHKFMEKFKYQIQKFAEILTVPVYHFLGFIVVYRYFFNDNRTTFSVSLKLVLHCRMLSKYAIISLSN